MHRPFPPLPHPLTEAGTVRKVGVEIEFSGLSEEETASVVQHRFGGSVSDASAHELSVTGTEIGDIEIELDTALRKLADSKLLDAGLSVARGVIPVEIVTKPLTLDQMENLDRLRDDLRKAGAVGTKDGILLGFGVHLNVEIVSAEAAHTARTVLAFALLEDWLRDVMKIDRTRRILPFVEPWPRQFAVALAHEGFDLTFETIRRHYSEHVNSRNHGLDLLPIFKDFDEAAFERDFPDHRSVKGRPAFHYRLPNSRIDEHAWSLREEWVNWCRVERLAADTEGLKRLAKAFTSRDERLISDRADWARYCASTLGTEFTRS